MAFVSPQTTIKRFFFCSFSVNGVEVGHIGLPGCLAYLWCHPSLRRGNKGPGR